MLLSPTTASRTLPVAASLPAPRHRFASLGLLLALWLTIFAGSLASPSLLDDADATHAEAAQSILRTGDWVTLHVDGIRYLEKAPLPYWIAAVSLRLFGANSFAIHLPLALAVLALAGLGYIWGRRAFGDRTGFYTGLFTLTATGVFLFTRVFLPDILLSLELALCLYAGLRALEQPRSATGPSALRWPALLWTSLGAAVLTKGLVAVLFLAATGGLYLALTGTAHRWRQLRPLSGLALFLLLAAPWHILAGLRNTGGAGGHGFFWFYFVNEHVLRFLGRRLPRDYNKLPAALYWSLHLVWLFPWSLFLPTTLAVAWRHRFAIHNPLWRRDPSFARATVLLLVVFSALVLVFFSLSTNQEYYTLPVYLPLLLLVAAALAHTETGGATGTAAANRPRLAGSLQISHAALTGLGLLIAAALLRGLYASRHLPFNPDIGTLLARRGVGNYTLSLSHFFDLTAPSFAALRLPASLAAAAFALGPALAWELRRRGHPQHSTVAVALTSAVFLVAAHLALCRFAPLLSSEDMASTILHLEATGALAPHTSVLLYGDQASGSSLIFYLARPVALVEGRSTSMLFGSTFADAPPLFLSAAELRRLWGHGSRKVLFIPPEHRTDVDRLLGPETYLLQETSGKVLLTDRPLQHSFR